ncbi:MAG: hypothetical protein A2268_11390 [Candidatus Raymondbacteria bacterium RifOxyA12_full_50_37]|nr:MAG: hypothetical protein A2268_11390 [Candidatus Raymondbacteria bacterium RifOxyA12_full_50_37]OGJ92372.1 MAG: hypothetical protein A2248_10515 [Candidatus Raymondbacteria bacterium RIFOXYA2_FULL_49_16]OGJ99353.1 MAG: hypothetical protein A2453_13575 [Candidatus Raymondbacteria bacterium RIFOXYC2_FULL_50_21]OGK02674.1 MAG: hypothetical protein A2487_00945 [Candidatus Raymondbacteria bacterium RifOxyC12_full_50_8]OGP44265.1 MAG: hypothetical protein A2324_04905 [Candidatus Raymondbacteria b
MKKNHLFLLFAFGFLSTGLYAALSTHSFTDKADRGSHPSTITYGSGRLIFNLSAISGATVYRAIFGVPRKYASGGGYPSSLYATAKTILISKAGDTLQIMGPRYMSFDATQAVQEALATSDRCTLTVASGPGFYSYGGMATLDVTCNLAADSALAQADSAFARFENGDVMITYKEVDPPFTSESITCDQYNAYYSAHFSRSNDNADWNGGVQKIRYRIYRSTEPLISENALANAELVDEITPLSCWDASYYGSGNCTGTKTVPLYPVDSLQLASPSIGIYVDRYKGNGSQTLYYFVSHTVDGAEDFSTLTEGVNATNSVEASTGTGMVVLREVQSNVTFQYKENATLNYYVKWECPPNCNTPSKPLDYLVAVPPNVIAKPMAQVSLHCWGGSINSCYCGWFRENEGGLLISTNQYPYDWWTAYHENSGTFKPFTEGTVQPYTEIRYLSFIFDFAVPSYNIDPERIMVAGISMGGAGASLWGLRSGHIFSNIYSWVGVHIPKESPTFTGSFAGSYGDTSWHCKYSNEGLERFGYPVIHPADNVDVWDYWDNTKWLSANIATETPWMSHSNGTNDNGIGWPQAWKNAQSLVSSKRGFNFHWGVQGHSTTVSYITINYQKNKSYPAITRGSLDDSLGSTPWAHDSTGDINPYIRWDPATIVDESDRWEMAVWLDAGASQATETADITPRRLQQLMHGAGSTYTWEFDEGATVVSSGAATADANGFITITGLTLSKTHRTLKINCDNCIMGASRVDAGKGKTSISVAPNPFNPVTNIIITDYGLQITNPALKIFNIRGDLVADLTDLIRNSKSVGRNSIPWDAGKHPSGIYLVKFTNGTKTLIQRMALVR